MISESAKKVETVPELEISKAEDQRQLHNMKMKMMKKMEKEKEGMMKEVEKKEAEIAQVDCFSFIIVCKLSPSLHLKGLKS